MNRFEVIDLLAEIKEEYPFFDVSDENINRHLKYLHDFPFDVAMQNVVQYIKTFSKKHPGIADIRYGFEDPLSKLVPSTEETQEQFKQLEKWREQAVPMPDHLRKELNRLVRGSRHPNS